MALIVLDTTLRDGSNAIDHMFGRDLTRNILIGLEEAGVELIEMGHGSGLGATENSGNKAALSDQEYMELAQETLNKAKFGFIILKKFGGLKEIKLTADKGASFIRIGSNITEVDQIEEMIKFAKDKGLMVLVALMKAYAMKPGREYIDMLNKLASWDVDLATLMDSAGYFLPQDVEKYIVQGKVNTDLKLGFHAHNNMQLAIANTVTAIKSGVDSVDASIGGLGRSAGNAPIEILAVLAKRYDWELDLDFKKLSGMQDELIYPLIKETNRFSSEAITFGMAGFHSSFFTLIKEINKKHPALDYRDIIMAVSKQEKVSLNEGLIEDIITKKLL